MSEFMERAAHGPVVRRAVGSDYPERAPTVCVPDAVSTLSSVGAMREARRP